MKKLFLCFLLIFLVGCSIQKPSEKEEEPSKTPEVQNIYKLGDYGDYVKYADESKDAIFLESDYLKLTDQVKGNKNGVFESNYESGLLDFFSLDKKIKLSIDIQKEELLKLNADFKSGNKESYRICNIDIEMDDLIFHYENVGIRQKGNTSRGAILDSNERINLRHYKLSFTETFDDDFTDTPVKWEDEKALEYRDNRNFFGIEKLNIRWNRNQEKTYIREFYAFEMYRNNGVLAPHSNLLQVEMNVDGDLQNLGVYLAVEDIDKTFLKRNIVKASAGGDLYKMGWTSVGATLDSLDDSLFGVEKQVKEGTHFKQFTYPYDLKTNKKTSKHESIKTFISNIINTETSQFDSFLKRDTLYDYLINYLSISYLLGDPDDLRGNYNNTYLYFLEDTNQAIFIPTDHDRALGSTGGVNGNPTQHHGAANAPFDDTTGYATNTSAFFTKTILEGGNQNIKTDYLAQIKIIIDRGWLNLATYQSYFVKAKKNYSDSIDLGKNVNGNKIVFSLAEEQDLLSEGNLSIEKYFETKKQSFSSFHWDPSLDVEVSYSNYYLRGQMNGWNGLTKEFCLKLIDGKPTLEIYLEENVPFKIADSNWQNEFNYDDLIEQSNFNRVGNEKNISVKVSGIYNIQILEGNKLFIIRL